MLTIANSQLTVYKRYKKVDYVNNLKKYFLKVAVVNRLSTAQAKYELLKNYDFIEVMTCPGGCLGGGGQPIVATSKMSEYRDKRRNSLYQKDKENNIKESYTNPLIKEAYTTYLNKHKEKLHTTHDKEKIHN